MSSPHVEGAHPRLTEFGSTVGEHDEGGRGSSASHQAITKIRIIGPAVSKRVSRGLTRAIRRPSDYAYLHTESLDHHNQAFKTDMMMTATTAHTKNTHPPTPETDDDDDDDDDIDEFDSGTAFSPLHCETPIPPLPRARIPSRLGAVSVQPCEPHELGEPLTQGMMLIGRPASRTNYNRICVPLGDRRRGEGGVGNTPSTQEMSGRITSLEEDLKPLLLCQSMGIKIETKPADFVPGTIARIVFHCPRCLKHWKLSGKPKAPSECKESHQPTRGPEYNISMQSHRIMQDLEKLPEYGKQQLIKVLSRTWSPGADEELLELVNSASSGFLPESSTSPHASRRSRSPEKRSTIKLSKDRKSLSPVEKFHWDTGQHEVQFSRSANGKRDSTNLRQGVTSAGVKSSVPGVCANTPNHQSKEEPTLTLEEQNGKEDNVNKKEDDDTHAATEEHTKIDKSLQDLDKRTLNKPTEHIRIPSGETSAAGQLIVEFEDIDGTMYHGFMSPTGNFVPIARVDHTGNRLPIAMKPDGGICIVSRYGSQALDLSSDGMNETQGTSHTERGIIEARDRTGAIVRGYWNLSGHFVPVARIDGAGLEHAVMMKTDGKFYVQSHNNDDDDVSCDEEVVVLSDSQLETQDESRPPAVFSNGQTILSCKTVQKRSEDTSITEVEGHDGFKYQGFDSPGFGFIPTAQVDPDGFRRPVVMNAEGEYTVVNADGRMIGVHLHCLTDFYRGGLKCTGCKFLSQSQSQSRLLFNVLSNTSSDSSDDSTFPSVSQVDVRKCEPNWQPDVHSITQVDHLAKTGENKTPSEKSLHKFRRMAYKREPDGSVYHGCCQSGQFVPVFRLDEQGCRYPVLKDSGGKYYTIDKDGLNRYTGEDDKDHTTDSRNKVVTRELNGYTFEGRHTIDGRFVPMSYLDDNGNRKEVMQSRNGQCIFSGRNGHINFVKFPGTDHEINRISGFNPADKEIAFRVGDDGLKYEGYVDSNREFIPTVRIDKSGYRQMVLINAKYQGYVVGYDGQVELVPFSIPRNSPKPKTKKKKFSQFPSGKSIKSECSKTSADDEGDLLGSAMAQSSHKRIKPRGSSFSVKYSMGDSSETYKRDDHDFHLSDGLNKRITVGVGRKDDLDKPLNHYKESQVKDARVSSGISLTSHQDGTVIYREKTSNESSKDMKKISKLSSRTGHSKDYPSKPEESAAIDDSPGKEEHKSTCAKNTKNVNHPVAKDDSKCPSFKEAAEHVPDIKNAREQRDMKGKPIMKNTAVHNVTGRPDTKAGQFRKHVFATPEESLTNTLALRRGTSQLDSQDTAGTKVGDPSELSNKERSLHPLETTKLPSLPKKPGLQLLSNGEREANSEAQDTSLQEGSESLSLALSLPEPNSSDRANALPRVGCTRRKSKGDKTIQKKFSENQQKASQASSENFSPETETNEANDFMDESQSPADLLNKYSKFKLTADPPLSPPPPLPQPSDKEATYRMMYSTIPSHLQSSSPPPQSTPVTQTFSMEQSKSPEPILFKKESSIVQVSTLPVNCDEVTLLAPKVSSPILMKNLLQPSQSINRSRTYSANHSLNHLLGASEGFPESINKIWQQYKREVEFLHQTFCLPLTNAFTFSMFELPKQYEEHNSVMRQKAKQIQKMKKPTKLGKPPQIWKKQRYPLPLKKTPKPLETIPYRIKAKIAKA